MSNSENTLDLFLTGFKARDIAEPLMSFDNTATPASIRAAMQIQPGRVYGIRKHGVVDGWLILDDLGDDAESFRIRSLEPTSIVADTAPLKDVVAGLNAAPYLFVNCLGHVCGVICRDDLQKPATRMWLFGLITITELRVTRGIEETYPNDSWRDMLSERRLQMAIDLQAERRRRHQNPSLLDCLQFGDKGQIVARDKQLRSRSRFESRRAVEEFVRRLQDLRNNLAHSQDISPNWDVIVELADNVHRIVLGPPSDAMQTTATFAGSGPASQSEGFAQ